MKTGIELIAEERREQIEKHGRTVEYDLKVNDQEQLVLAATYIILKDWEEDTFLSAPDGWDSNVWKHICDKPYQERLIIAGALIAAEIDRISNE